MLNGTNAEAVGKGIALMRALIGLALLGATRLRGWLEAGCLADAIDVPATAGARSLDPAVRIGGAVFAGTFAAVGGVCARRL